MGTVLIVDDSELIRKILAEAIAGDSGLKVAGYASEEEEIFTKIKELDPDLITIDIDMVHIDTISLINKIMDENPKPILVVSDRSKKDSFLTFKALEAGAVDFILKPADVNKESGFSTFKNSLVSRLKVALKSTPKEIKSGQKKVIHCFKKSSKKVLLIGASTGGPSTVQKLFSELPGNLPFPILVVQHMPQGFTKSFSERLNNKTDFLVKEAEEGEVLKDNVAYVCPADYHMNLIERRGGHYISLNQDERVHNVRPSFDCLIESVVPLFKERTVMVILTGMGRDGTRGAELVRKHRGRVIAESEESCIIYGMSKSVIEKELANTIVSLDKLAVSIIQEMEK